MSFLPLKEPHTGVDELDQPFDEILHATRDPRGDLVGDFLEQVEEQRPERDGPEHGIDMDGPEAHSLGLRRIMCDTPAPVRQLAEGEIGQVVPYVFTGGESFACHCC